tara:strand:- start:6 stop:491 length:486 start_codon:yes stop_codon:yes gene_type:complete
VRLRIEVDRMSSWETLLKIERKNIVHFYRNHEVLQMVEVIWQTNPNLPDGKKYPSSSTFSNYRNRARDETYSIDDPDSPIKIKSIRQVLSSKQERYKDSKRIFPEAKHPFVPIDFLLKKYDKVLIYLETDKGLNDPRKPSLEIYSVEEHDGDLVFMFGRGY